MDCTLLIKTSDWGVHISEVKVDSYTHTGKQTGVLSQGPHTPSEANGEGDQACQEEGEEVTTNKTYNHIHLRIVYFLWCDSDGSNSFFCIAHNASGLL